MIKYLNTMVTFAEIPVEVTLSRNLTNCQNKCPGCHSPELRENIGTELTKDELNNLINKNKGVSCVLFMGEGNDREALIELAKHVKSLGLKPGLYSGAESVPESVWEVFDYIKIGPYIEKLGPLNKETTNQRLYKRTDSGWEDITKMFWK